MSIQPPASHCRCMERACTCNSAWPKHKITMQNTDARSQAEHLMEQQLVKEYKNDDAERTFVSASRIFSKWASFWKREEMTFEMMAVSTSTNRKSVAQPRSCQNTVKSQIVAMSPKSQGLEVRVHTYDAANIKPDGGGQR